MGLHFLAQQKEFRNLRTLYIKGTKQVYWDERKLSDKRILGSGDFPAQVLDEASELEERRIKNRISLEEVLQKVSADMEIELKEFMSRSRRTKISMARAIVSYWAVREMGYPGIEIARILNLSGRGLTKSTKTHGSLSPLSP